MLPLCHCLFPCTATKMRDETFISTNKGNGGYAMIPSFMLAMRILVWLFSSMCLGIAIPLTICFSSVWDQRTLLTAWVMSALGGLLFGSALTLVLGGWHIYAVHRLGYRLTDDTLSVRQHRRLLIDLSFQETFALCAATATRFGTIRKADITDGVILAESCVSLLSFGQLLSIRLWRAGNCMVVEIDCRPSLRATLVDYGTSLHQMDVIVTDLLSHSSRLRIRLQAIPGREMQLPFP